MARRPLRVATTNQLAHASRVAGFDTYLLPETVNTDINRSLDQRLADGDVYRPFLEAHDIELVVDLDTSALTLSRKEDGSDEVCLTTAKLGIPYVCHFIDPVTATMGQVAWEDRWRLLQCDSWIKWIWESAHADELKRLGIPNVLTMPMAAPDGDYDTSPALVSESGPVLAFLGHPASSWFGSDQQFPANLMFPAMTAIAVQADMPDLPFHKIYFDLYEFDKTRTGAAGEMESTDVASRYFNDKFLYSAFLAVKQRDRFARFLTRRLGDHFELVGDHWGDVYGLRHTPRVWDRQALIERMRRVPICLNLAKGCLESGMNLRHFETTAAGGFMLTYETPELSSCFEIGVECDVFHSESDLLEKISFYLKHPEKRREIALAGQRRTLSGHLHSHRLVTLVELLRKAGVLPGGLSGSEEAHSMTAEKAAVACISVETAGVAPSNT